MNEDLLARLADLEFGKNRLRQGYDRTDVEEFRMGLGELLAAGEDVSDAFDSSRFRPVPKGEGYATWQVDLRIKEIIRAAAMSPVARRIEETRFTPRRLRGYDMGDVDAFLDELQATAERGGSLAERVAAKRFRTSTMREGYDREEVEAFVAALVADVEGVPVVRPSGTAEPLPSVHTPPGSGPVGSAPWVRATTFAVREFAHTYAPEDVMRLRDAVGLAVDAGQPVDQVIEDHPLAKTAFGIGCDAKGVDRWIKAIRQTQQP